MLARYPNHPRSPVTLRRRAAAVLVLALPVIVYSTLTGWQFGLACGIVVGLLACVAYVDGVEQEAPR